MFSLRIDAPLNLLGWNLQEPTGVAKGR